MRALGCTYGQGYFFSMPLSPDDVVAAFAREGLTSELGESGVAAGAVPAKAPVRGRRLPMPRTSPAA